MSSIVVCDAGPIIHLDELDAAELLSDFPMLLAPSIVLQEVRRHRPLAVKPATLRQLDADQTITPRLQAFSQLFLLHRGEMEALRLAQEQNAQLFLTDDSAARLAATNLQLEVHGTLGILVRAIRRKQRTPAQVISLLRSIPERSTLHIRGSLLEDIIHRVKSGK